MDLYYQRKGVKSDKKLEKIMTDTWHLLKTAKELGIKYEEIPYTGIFRLEYRGKVEFLYHRTPVQTTSTASRCCDNKMVTKNLLERAGLAVPSGYMLKEQDGQKYQLEVFDKVKKPLVVKAIDGSEALHVSLNITKTADYLKALKSSFSYDRIDNSRALVEEMFVGDEFRILATREKVLSIIYRIEANVVGDGEHTVQELIDIKNMDEKRGTHEENKPLFNIEIDQELVDFLAEQGLTLDEKIDKDKQIFLRPNSEFNISQGGDTIDVTDQVHPSVKNIAMCAVKAIPGLSWTGIDLLSTDIYQEQTANNYRILELNVSPRIIWQEFPYQGPRRYIAYDFLKLMFPGLPEKK